MHLDERLCRILGAVQDGIVVVDDGGRCTFANPAAARLLGYQEHELIGRALVDLVQVDLVQEERAPVVDAAAWPIARALAAGTAQAGEDVLRRRDGGTFPVEYSASPLVEGGAPAGAVLTFRDATRRRQGARDQAFLVEAGDRLMASLEYETTLEEVLRLAVPRLADWCFVDLLQPDGVSFRRLAVAHTGQPGADESTGEADDRKAELAQRLQRCCPPITDAAHGVARVVRTGEPEVLAEPPETLVPALAGVEDDLTVMRELEIRSYMCVPLAARGRMLGALTCITSESGRHYDADDAALAMELARRAALAVDNARLHTETEQAVRSRDEVLAIVSHDLKNPIATIQMSADFMLEVLPPEDDTRARERQQFAVIRRSAQRATRLIRDLLDAARLEETGALRVEPRSVALAPLLHETVEQFAPQAAAKRMRLDVQLAPALPAVCADRDRTLQVLSNLVGNAVKFTPAGGAVRVSAERREDAVCVSVSDTGPGLSEEERRNLFNRYWQAKRTAKLGSGLGLAIAKGIVESLGGRIWVESELGRGAAFRFTLPALDAAANGCPCTTPDATPGASPGAGTSEAGARGEPESAVVVRTPPSSPR